MTMAKPVQLTKDEVWLTKTFRVDVGKFDKETREGGKKRKQFIDDLNLFHKLFDKVDPKQYDKFTGFKSGNPKIKKLQDAALAAQKKMLAQVKAGDVDNATNTVTDVLGALEEINKMVSPSRGEGGVENVGQRLGAGWIH